MTQYIGCTIFVPAMALNLNFETKKQAALIKRAARIKEVSMTRFILRASEAAARELIKAESETAPPDLQQTGS